MNARANSHAVIGFMSDKYIDPALAVEVFVLEPQPTSHSSHRA